MNRATTDKIDPWRVPIIVAQIPDTGLHRDLEADAAARKAMAELAGLREVLSASASFDVIPKSDGRFQVTGNVRARIGQTCVVTLDPIESDIDEEVDLIFAPVEQIPEIKEELADETGGDESELAEPPEPIVNGIIDLGRLATDVLYLAIDPYPRKPGAVFEPHIVEADPEDHPFAALNALKGEAKKPKSSG
jgi:hypothetical protein